MNKKLILHKSDFDLLEKYVTSRMESRTGDSGNAQQLFNELKEALVYEAEADMPGDVVRLHSKVLVQERNTGRLLKFRIVLPAQANLDKGRLSVFAPLGVALMGYRKGHEVRWTLPAGEKVFVLLDVNNEKVSA